MSNSTRFSVAILTTAAVVMTGLLVACDSQPTRPTVTPSPGDTFRPVRLEITGPRSVPPGETAQLKAVATGVDGTTQDVTATATWRVSQAMVMSIQRGLVTGMRIGEAFVSANIAANPTIGSSKEVIVVPAGTYRVVGSVSEADDAAVPVVEARIEITGGQATGAQATTGIDGRYRLYGLAGETTLRVSKDGYQAQTQTIAVTDHAQLTPVSLPLSRPRVDISGSYTLTISADPACSSILPDAARTRTYSAMVTLAGPRVDVALVGAEFALNPRGSGNHFTGRAEPTQLVFALARFDSYYYSYYGGLYYADIVEALGEASYLTVWGNVSALGTSGAFSGTLDGSFDLYARDLRNKVYQNPTVSCRSGVHRFQLSR